MYGKKKMMGGGKMPKPMMKKGGKMTDPEKPKLGMKKSSEPKEKKILLKRSSTSIRRKLMEPVKTTKSGLAPMGSEKLTPTKPSTMVAVRKGKKTEVSSSPKEIMKISMKEAKQGVKEGRKGARAGKKAAKFAGKVINKIKKNTKKIFGNDKIKKNISDTIRRGMTEGMFDKVGEKGIKDFEKYGMDFPTPEKTPMPPMQRMPKDNMMRDELLMQRKEKPAEAKPAEMKKGGYMKKGGKMIKSKAPVTFAPKSAKNVKGPSPKMAKGGKMKSC